MLSKECKSCTYCQWMVGLGMGVRCSYFQNQKYKNSNSHKNLPVMINLVPIGCSHKVSKHAK